MCAMNPLKYFCVAVRKITFFSANLSLQYLVAAIISLLSPGVSFSGTQNCTEYTSEQWFTSIKSRDVSKVRRLIEQGIDVNQTSRKGKTALIISATKGNIEITTALLKAGAAINATNPRGGTSLMYATVNNDIEMVRLLLAHQANVNAAGSNGWTALMIASAKGYNDILRLLIDHGAEVNARDIYGWTPLMRAAFEKRSNSVRFLLSDSNIDVNARDDRGATALHHVASKGYAEIARILLKNGADVRSKDHQGHTPLMVASAHRHTSLITLLRPPEKAESVY